MPIYEFACPKCRTIYSLFSRRINPEGSPRCPGCGGRRMVKQMSSFAMLRGQGAAPDEAGGGEDGMDEARLERVFAEVERDLPHLDENNPRHLAHLMRRMQSAMPDGAMPKEMERAIRRLEAGEDPEKIEEDMGDLFAGMGDGEGEDPAGSGLGGYRRDTGLHDFEP